MPYLADTSIWAWARTQQALREKLADRVERGEVATCVPVALEVLHSARSGSEYEVDYDELLGPLDWLPLSPAVGARAIELQRSLAGTSHGAHRIPPIDYLIAGVAEQAGGEVVLWHADADLRRLCDFSGQPHEHERVSRRAR